MEYLMEEDRQKDLIEDGATQSHYKSCYPVIRRNNKKNESRESDGKGMVHQNQEIVHK